MADPISTQAPELNSSIITEASLAQRAVRGGLWVAVSSYFNIALGFLSNLVLTRILAPEDFGVYALAGFFLALVDLRPKIGIASAFAQRKETTGELVGTHLALDVTAGLATLLLVAAAVPVLRAFGYAWDVAWVMFALAGVSILNSTMSTAWILLDKELHFGPVSLINSLAFPLSYLPAFWLAMQGGGYWSLVAQNGTYAFLLAMGLWWTARRQLPHIWQLRWRFDRQVAVSLVRFGGMVGLAYTAGMLLTQFDNFLVGTFVSLAALGFYDRAYRIAEWPSLLVTSVANRAAFYTYARLQDDPVRLQKSVTLALWLISALSLPLALAIFMAAPDLVALFYGDRWLPSVPLLQLLVIYAVARPILENVGTLFTAVGRPHLASLTVAIEVAILVASGVPLTLRWGAIGTCVAVGLAFGSGLVVRTIYARRLVSLPLWNTLVVPIAAAVSTVVAFWLLEQAFGSADWPLVVRVVVKFAFALLAFFAVLFALQSRLAIERVRYTWQLAVAHGGERPV